MLVLSTILITASSSYACMGGQVQLNDDTILLAEGIKDISENKVYSFETLLTVKSFNSKMTTGKAIDILDSKNNKTHKIVILGSMKDEKGIFFTSYLVKDLKTNKESIEIVKSNYAGNGSIYRELEPKVFNTQLNTNGC